MICPECGKEMTKIWSRVEFPHYTKSYFKCENPECKVQPINYDIESLEFD